HAGYLDAGADAARDRALPARACRHGRPGAGTGGTLQADGRVRTVRTGRLRRPPPLSAPRGAVAAVAGHPSAGEAWRHVRAGVRAAARGARSPLYGVPEPVRPP